MSRPFSRRSSAVVVSACWSLGALCLARAAQHDVTWIGGASGNWQDAASWTGGVVPANTPSDAYNVYVDGNPSNNSAITLQLFDTGSITIDSLTIDAGDQVNAFNSNSISCLNAATINGTYAISDRGALALGGGQPLVGSGTIILTGPIGAGGSVICSGDLAVPQSMHVTGPAGIISAAGALRNYGTIRCDNESSLDSLYGVTLRGSTIINEGTIILTPHSALAIDTTFHDFTEFGTIVNQGGYLRVRGTLDNVGRTFTVDHSNGTIEIAGTVHGGTITIPTGQTLTVPPVATFLAPAILDDTVVDGALIVDGRTKIVGEKPLSGQLDMKLIGGQVYSYVFVDRGLDMVVGADARIHGVGVFGYLAATTVNRGILESDTIAGSKFEVRSDHLLNEGTLRRSSMGNFTVAGDLTFAAGARFEQILIPGDTGFLSAPMIDLSTMDDYLVVDTSRVPIGSTFTIVRTTNGIQGEFDHVIGNVTVSYTAVPNSIRVTVVAPEPAGAVALGSISLLLRRNRVRRIQRIAAAPNGVSYAPTGNEQPC